VILLKAPIIKNSWGFFLFDLFNFWFYSLCN